jgi:hypothetical protein
MHHPWYRVICFRSYCRGSRPDSGAAKTEPTAHVTPNCPALRCYSLALFYCCGLVQIWISSGNNLKMEYKKGRSSFLRCIVGHLFIFLRIYTRMEGEQHRLTMLRPLPGFRFFPTDARSSLPATSPGRPLTPASPRQPLATLTSTASTQGPDVRHIVHAS